VELPLDFHRNDKVRISYRLKNMVKGRGRVKFFLERRKSESEMGRQTLNEL